MRFNWQTWRDRAKKLRERIATQLKPHSRFRKRLKVSQKLFRQWLSRRSLINPKLKEYVMNLYKGDLILNPITWFGFLTTYGLILGGIISTLLWSFLEVLSYTSLMSANPLSGWLYMTLWGALTLLAFVPSFDENGDIFVEKVPQTFFIAYVTVFGMLIPVGRITGTYPCTGAWVGLGRSTAVSNTVTDKNGFVRGGDVTFEVWQSAHSKEIVNGKIVGETRITEPAKNGASVTASLTAILERIQPKSWLDAEDADTEVGNAFRQAYLQFLANFNDTDVPAVVGLIKDWMVGSAFVTAYTPRKIREYRAGSLVRDINGKPLIIRVEKDETEAEAIERFKQDYLPLVESEMKKPEGSNRSLTLKPVVVKTTHPVHGVVERRGYSLKTVNLEGVKYSSKVQEEADNASSEFFQQDSQRRSAEAQAKYREKLGLGADATYAEQMAAALAFAQDNPESAQVVISPGGTDSITKGAALVASTIKKGEKND